MVEAAQEPNFDKLSDFAKPGACEFSLTCKPLGLGEVDKAKATIGWRPGDNRIYYEDTAIAGHYSLPKPLSEMAPEELDQVFPEDRRCVVGRESFMALWKLTQEEK